MTSDLNPISPRNSNLRAQVDQRIHEMLKLRSDIRQRIIGREISVKLNAKEAEANDIPVGIFRIADVRFAETSIGSAGDCYLQVRWIGSGWRNWTEVKLV